MAFDVGNPFVLMSRNCNANGGLPVLLCCHGNWYTRWRPRTVVERVSGFYDERRNKDMNELPLMLGYDRMVFMRQLFQL